MSNAHQRVVFHIPEGDVAYGKRALENVTNLRADETVDVSISVVANGGGLEHLYSDARTADTVRELLDAGVEFFACENTIERSDREPDELVDGVSVASSGVGELTRQQTAGAGYIRP